MPRKGKMRIRKHTPRSGLRRWWSLVCLLILTAPIGAVQAAPTSPLTSYLSDIHGSDYLKRDSALESLKKFQPSSQEDIALLVDDVHRNQNISLEAALESLARTPKGAVDLKNVVAMLDDKDARIQIAGIKLLGAWNARGTAPRLRKMLFSAPRPKSTSYNAKTGEAPSGMEVQFSLVSTLSIFGDLNAVDSLLSEKEMPFAGLMVAQFGAGVLPTVIPLARRHAIGRNDARKRQALEAIRYMRDEEAIPQLIQLIGDPELYEAAISSLKYMSPKTEDKVKLIDAAIDTASKSEREYVRMWATEARMSRPKPRAPLLTLEDIRSVNSSERLRIFYGLMQSERTDAIPVLKEFIKENERIEPNWTTERQVAAQAVYALTGEMVPYRGVENDRRIYPNPYDPTGRYGSQVSRAIDKGDLNAASTLINGAPNLLNLKDAHGMPPLRNAARANKLEIVKFLVGKGADLNGQDDMGMTALHWATLFGYTEVVTVLLDAGARTDMRDANGILPLHEAALGGQANIIELLIAKGADVNAVTRNGFSPVDFAITKGQREAERVLRSHGGEIKKGSAARH